MPKSQSVTAPITITESLAEIKTLGKRIAKKMEGLSPYLARVEQMKDPLEGDGGSVEFIRRERQSIKDMQARIIRLRAAIAYANATTDLTVHEETRNIADWLTWRREVAPNEQTLLSQLRNNINALRTQAQQKGVGFVNAAVTNVQVTDAKPNDILVNISEVELAAELDHIQEVLGVLDGQLSLKNATTLVTI